MIETSSCSEQSDDPHRSKRLKTNSSAQQQPDKCCWHGFCEIESEPALFNVMLRDFGVQGVKVQEVISLDDEMLELLQHTVNYACASVALLNIINNVSEIELGDQLRHFKEFTMDFTPALRGDAISNFEFVKAIHNSFARKMDILNVDLQLKNEWLMKSKNRKINQNLDESEAGFHFVAFVPVDGKVWKFDGLERQPQSLGDFSGSNWFSLAKPEIQARMAEYEEGQIEFSILSLAKDPMVKLVDDLAANVQSLEAIEGRLNAMDMNETSTSSDDATIFGPDPSFGLTPSILAQKSLPEDVNQEYQSMSTEQLLRLRTDLIKKQENLRALYTEESQARGMDDLHAARRRHDYGPAIHSWLRALSRKGLVEHLVGDM